MNNIIAQQEIKFEELKDNYQTLLNNFKNNSSSVFSERLLLINSKIDDLCEEIEHLQYECDNNKIKKSIKAKERIKDYERSKVFMDKMFPLLFIIFDEMCKVDQA